MGGGLPRAACSLTWSSLGLPGRCSPRGCGLRGLAGGCVRRVLAPVGSMLPSAGASIHTTLPSGSSASGLS